MSNTYLLFDPDTHKILSIVHTNSASAAERIGHPHRAEIEAIRFDENLLFDPTTRTVYAGPKP